MTAPVCPPPANLVLRIKRKRNEEPVDILVVQQPVDAFKRAKLLLNNNCPAADADAPTASAEESLNVPVCFQRMKTVVSLEDSIVVSTSRLKSNDYSTTTPASYRPSIKQYSSPDSSATSSSKRRLEILNQQLKLSKAARYTVVKRNRRATGSVGAAAGQEDDVQVVDVVKDTLPDYYDTYGIPKVRRAAKPRQPKQSSIEDEIMCNFEPMIREYLNLQSESSTDSSAGAPNNSKNNNNDHNSSDDEYVYDIYTSGVTTSNNGEELDDNKDAIMNMINNNNSTSTATNTTTSGSSGAVLAELKWDYENGIFLEDEGSDDEKDAWDDQDSNAEDHFAHEYPDEDDFSDDEEEQRNEWGDETDDADDGDDYY